MSLFCLIRLVAAGLLAPGRAPAARSVRVDPNQAAVGELMALPSIGRALASAIVLHRVRHGPFVRVDDLARVDGIGPKRVERLRPFLHIR